MTNLGQQPVRILRHVVRRLRGRPSPRLPWPFAVTVTLTLYSLLTLAFWALSLWWVGPAIGHAASHLAASVVAFASQLAGRGSLGAPPLREALTAIYLLLFPSILAVRLFRWALARILSHRSP